jgi:membrane-associated phospholipid phosphatase
MRMNDFEIKVRGLARGFTTIIPIVSILVGFIFRENFGMFLGGFLLICDFINHFVKKFFKWWYNKEGVEELWLIGRGERPEGAKHCGSFINENDMNGKATSFGMPSGHSQMAITVALMIIMFLGNKYGGDARNIIAMFIVAILAIGILISRWWMGCHTWGQIAVGSVFGIIYGLIGWFVFKAIFLRDSETDVIEES